MRSRKWSKGVWWYQNFAYLCSVDECTLLHLSTLLGAEFERAYALRCT
nr:MAG TPA: hypothetical protein [Caudoviricetes sp.]